MTPGKYWPNPEASTGKHYQNVNLGRNQCWEAVGEARQKFKEIASEVKAYLEKCNDPIAHPVVWTMYMIGPNRGESKPTLMFCGKDKKSRIEIKETIKGSGIMDEHPGAESNETTISNNNSRDASSSHGQEIRNITEDHQNTYIETTAGVGKAILYSSLDVGPEMSILIQGFHSDPSSLIPATGGGFVCHQGTIFLLTVAHAFHEDATNLIPGPSEDYDIEFELDDDSEKEGEEGRQEEAKDENKKQRKGKCAIEVPSRGSVTTKSSDLFDSPIAGSISSDIPSEFRKRLIDTSIKDPMLNMTDVCQFPIRNSVITEPTTEPRLVKPDIPLLEVGGRIILSTMGHRPGLDYCLIEVKANELLNFKPVSSKLDKPLYPLLSGVVVSEPKDVDVIASIGSGGLLRGRLSGTPSFLMLPGSNSVQEVWTVRHDTDIFNGDCGAWVVDACNGDLFRRIIGGSPSMNVSYIIPAHLVFNDLKERSDGEWKPHLGTSVHFPGPQFTPVRKRQLNSGGWISRQPSQTSLFDKFATPAWNPHTQTRRKNVQYANENVRLVDCIDLEEEGLVRSFMKNHDESESCLPRADKVEEWCFGASLEMLQKKGGGGNRIVALLDERSENEARVYKGPLTARDLYRLLLKPRYHIIEHGNMEQGVRSTEDFDPSAWNSDLDGSKEERLEKELEAKSEPDAERAKIFITDLDRWTIVALMATASKNQAIALRDAIYMHLQFEAFVGATFPSTSLAMFQLAFHIPFYAWRTSEVAYEDYRLNSKARRLRRSRDVSFLNWDSFGHSDFLYEAQYTCLIAGTDETHWVAYGFFDTYFDSVAKESVEGYHEDSLEECGILSDPLTYGNIDATKAIPTAREYWLCVFQHRIRHVLREWEQIVMKVKESIDEYDEAHSNTASLSREHVSLRAEREHEENVRRSRDWVVHAKRLTKNLFQHLSRTVDACEKFRLHHSKYFKNIPEQPDARQSLLTIDQVFNRLEVLKRDLEDMTDKCSGFARELKLWIMLENQMLSDLQNKILQEKKRLGLIMMYTIPIAISAGILSMNLDMIAFAATSFRVFAGLIFTFSISGILIHMVLQYRGSSWQILTALSGQGSWERIRRKGTVKARGDSFD